MESTIDTTQGVRTQAPMYRGVVIPHHPRTDENAVIAVYQYLEMRRLGLTVPPKIEVEFWGHPDCPDEKMAEFLLAKQLLPVEIGDLSYQKVKNSKGEKAGSATEAMLITLGYDPTVVSLDYGVLELVRILARRNRDGYMNTFFMSLPKNLKNVYGLRGYDERDVMTRYQDIVHAYLEYENRPEYPVKVQIPEELQDLARTTEKCQLAPFTPGRYLRDLCYCGESTDQIREKVQFWITASNNCQKEYLKAKSDWPKMTKLHFSLNGLRAAAVETTNQFVSRVAFNREDREAGLGFELVIIRNPESGHTAIMTSSTNRKKDVSALSAELERLEPGRWYHHQSTGNLINGGLAYPEVTPTDLFLSDLAGIVSKFPPE